MPSFIQKWQEESEYVNIPNNTVRDARLSFKARGLLAYLLSLPENWKVNVEHLASESEKDGRDSISSAINELVSVRYVIKERLRNPDTKAFSGFNYYVYKKPQTEKPETGLPETGLPYTAKPQLQSKENTNEIEEKEKKNKANSADYKKEFEEFIESCPMNVTAKTASYFIKLGWKPKESIESLRSWITELAKLRNVTAEEFEKAVHEWYVYWSARPEKPIKNHKTSLMNTPLLNKDKWKKN